MVGYYNNMFYISFRYAFFKKLQTPYMFHVEPCPVKGFIFSIFYTPEIGNTQFRLESILSFDVGS